MNLRNFQLLTGNIGKIESKNLDSGQTVVNLSIATNEKWKDKDGNKQEETTWHDCNAWGKTAETITRFFSKGDPITVQGMHKVRIWTDDSGNKRYNHYTKVNTFAFPLTAKPKEADSFPPPSEPNEDLPF